MLELKNIKKDYIIDKTPYPALKGISLFFSNSGFAAILGPSGCGKTTMLNIIGGLDRYTSGDLVIEGISTTEYRDKDWDNYRNKRIGFVFQSYNLISHLSILENVELSLTLDGIGVKERKLRSQEVLEKVGLKGITHKKPNQLSGGQMQRVAIARSLINNPDIILADEPTGALDTETSVQVLDILKEISKEKLVIMVTHNEKLAKKYADRIISMKDGEIISDTNPQVSPSEINTINEENIEKNEEFELKLIDDSEKKPRKTPIKIKKEKTSMSFITALLHSLKNLWTKKGRTILTSIAASFGIIGVALVLAMSNGFQNYIDRVQSDTASQMPITVNMYNVSYEVVSSYQYEQFTDEEYIYPYITDEVRASYTYNNVNEKYLNYLKYLRDEEELISDYIVNYSTSYSFNLMTDFVQDDGTSELGIVRNGTSSSIISTISSYIGIPNSYFHVLYGEEDTIESNYDLVAGTYPQSNDELVLVVDTYNRLNPTILKRFGFYSDNAENDYMYENPISFDDILNKKFKIFNLDEFYKEERQITRTDNMGNDRTFSVYSENDYETLFNDNNVGKELKISGILRPSSNNSLNLFSSGVCYLPSLQTELVEENMSTNVYKNFQNLMVFDKQDSNGNAYSFNDFILELADLYNSVDAENTSSISVSSVNNIINKYFSFYSYIAHEDPSLIYVYSNLSSYFTAARNCGVDLLTDELKENGVEGIEDVLRNLYTDLLRGNSSKEQVDDAYSQMISIYAYINSFSEIQSIIIFPKSLTAKAKLLDALDSYNVINTSGTENPHQASNAQEVVTYTDLVGAVADGLAEMINVISIVLIIFASISLAVSCVMTGIITYSSVIERTKEIGILRALGARKKDVGRLFQAESCIVGAISGIIGCAVAYLICVPINVILNNIYGQYNIGTIADLNILHALILVIISIVLTFVSGLVPSRIAAKKDPVIALRTE